MVVCSRMDALHVLMRLGDGGSRFGDDNRSSKFEVEQRRRGTLRATAAAAAASSSSRRGENIVPMIASGKQSSEGSTFVTLGYSLDRGAKFGNKTIGSKTIFFHAAGRQESIPGSELSDAAAAMEQSRDNLEEATGTMPESLEILQLPMKMQSTWRAVRNSSQKTHKHLLLQHLLLRLRKLLSPLQVTHLILPQELQGIGECFPMESEILRTGMRIMMQGD